jgi:hypothetical protein
MFGRDKPWHKGTRPQVHIVMAVKNQRRANEGYALEHTAPQGQQCIFAEDSCIKRAKGSKSLLGPGRSTASKTAQWKSCKPTQQGTFVHRVLLQPSPLQILYA